MKKITALCLLVMMILSLSVTALAANKTPAKDYDPAPATGHGAWSYVKVSPVSGEVARTHYIYSNYKTSTPPIEGEISSCKGLSYNAKSNTITISKFNQEDMVLLIHNMGTNFTIKLSGKNTMRSIKVENENWDSGLTISGKGSITLGKESDHSRIPLDVYGNLTLNSGTIKCVAEKTDIQSIGGLRQTVQVRGTSKMALTTAVKYKGDLSGIESENDTYLVTTKDTISFSGTALKKLSVKRSGNKVSWKKIKGCKYQIKGGKTVKGTSVKSKKKIQVRAIKTKNGVTICSAWSKKI